MPRENLGYPKELRWLDPYPKEIVFLITTSLVSTAAGGTSRGSYLLHQAFRCRVSCRGLLPPAAMSRIWDFTNCFRLRKAGTRSWFSPNMYAVKTTHPCVNHHTASFPTGLVAKSGLDPLPFVAMMKVDFPTCRCSADCRVSMFHS